MPASKHSRRWLDDPEVIRTDIETKYLSSLIVGGIEHRKWLRSSAIVQRKVRIRAHQPLSGRTIARQFDRVAMRFV
jgi:hypothetical protein